jgi:hypothetical protein
MQIYKFELFYCEYYLRKWPYINRIFEFHNEFLFYHILVCKFDESLQIWNNENLYIYIDASF